ncbi:MAG TPA: fibro-slime domain-containing protein [Fibrobacteria bacterium]|nr:fibro-slime domain-containing protein [Fibrobacteria bacterium]
MVAVLLAQSQAAKVLLFLSPFGKTGVCLTGGSWGYNACTDSSSSRFRLNARSWMEFDFATSPTGGIGINQGNWVWQSTEFRVDSLFSTRDTIWAIPDPYPVGKTLKLLTEPPKTRTILLWNPWESDGTVPWMRNAAGAWSRMSANPTLPGWYSSMVVGYQNLTLTFSDSARTRYFGATGVSTVAAPLGVDSIGNVSDTVWVRGTPEVGPVRAIATGRQPEDKVVMLLNPWGGIHPIQHPRITIGGKGPLAMHADANHCGWYGFSHFDRTPQVVFSNEKTLASFGAGGPGSTGTIDLSSLPGDTSWVFFSDGKVQTTSSPPALRGVCEFSFLAATIRDFPSDRSNLEFAWGPGCERGGYGVVKGMVDSTLGPDRKPVRSRHDTGSMIREGWWERFGNRCTYDTIRPAAMALVGDTGIATTWFRTVQGKNAETCRDIPLQLDSVGKYYVYDNQNYFPIDDFSRLSDGSANPYFDQIPGNDGKQHNYGFCLESHGEFEYRKGQVFKFTGDDDVWFFIDNRLVVDLGGIHGAASDSVLLDSLGLVEDATYPFDFFFCERDPAGSDMMIRTTMNLRTSSNFRLTDTTRRAGLRDFQSFVSTTVGQGCRAKATVLRSAVLARISGPSFPLPRHLPNGLSFGGIQVDSASGRVVVDSSSLVGLLPGTYTIQFKAGFDTTVVRQATFEVPFSVFPAFSNDKPLSLAVGGVFPVDVVARNPNGLDPSSSPFRIRAPAGLALFADSTLTVPVVATSALATGANGAPLRLWAKALAAGTWALAIGKGASDTADLWMDIAVAGHTIAWVDPTGAKVSPSPLTLQPGKDGLLRVGIFLADTLCTSCTEAVSVASSDANLVLSAIAGGPSTATLTPVRGVATLHLASALPVDSANIHVALVSDPSKTLDWNPVRVLGWRLTFVDSTGLPVVPRAVVLDPQEGLRLRVGLFFGDSLCISCADQVGLSASDPSMTFSVTAGGVASSVLPLSAGIATFWVRGAAALVSGSVHATLASDPRVAALWKPISVQMWRLRFAKGNTASDTLDPIDQQMGSNAPVEVRMWGRSGPCDVCTGILSLTSRSGKVLFTDPSGAPIATLALAAGRASFLVVGAQPVRSDTLVVTTDAGISLAGFPVTFRVAAPDSARMLDRDGDGRADSLVVHLHRPGSPSNRLRASWPGAAPLVEGTRTTFLDSSTMGVAFDAAFAPNATSAASSVAQYSWSGDDWTSVSVQDGIAPVPMRAWISWGDRTLAPDTLRVVVSESVKPLAATSLVRLGPASGIPDQADVRRGGPDTLLLLWNPASLATCPVPGDSLALMPSVVDAFGNAPLPWSRKVAIEGRGRPPRTATYLDSDGDGRIDRVRLSWASRPSLPWQSYDLDLPGALGTQSRTDLQAQAWPGDTLSGLIQLAEPFPFGWTRVPPGSWVRERGGPMITTLDGAGAVIDTAFIRRTELVDGHDTLLVLPSEPLSGSPRWDWARVLRMPSKAESGIPVQVPRWKGDTLLVELGDDSATSVRTGDSLRWTDRVLDASGNPASVRWRPIGASPRPLFLNLLRPKPLFTPPQAGPSDRSLQLQVDASGSWRGWDLDGTSSASADDQPCDTVHCSGPTLEINQPVTLSLHIYDHTGVFVDSRQLSLDPRTLPRDGRDRVRVRILWNGRTTRHTQVAQGVYLMRLILRTGPALHPDPMTNLVWKIGVVPPNP